MSYKERSVLICDFCGKEIDEETEHIHIDDIPHEGSSELIIMPIRKTNNYYCFNKTDFCNLDCFINDIKKYLKIK